ncbi:MAG TPA: hypothetical protein VE642_10665, partial [Pyrinomonadaceae bacterium]|nr:hypothetical protein [Pyrinomonadaceae bacterium]
DATEAGATPPAPPEPGAPGATDATTDTVYCEHAGAIVPLDEGFCRACSRQAHEGDGVHHPVTPELMKRLGYATTTEVPDTDAPSEETPPEGGETK